MQFLSSDCEHHWSAFCSSQLIVAVQSTGCGILLLVLPMCVCNFSLTRAPQTVLSMMSPFKFLPYKMASANVCVCVCVLVPQKSNREHCVLRVSLMYACRRAYGSNYKMVTFITKKELSNTVYLMALRPISNAAKCQVGYIWDAESLIKFQIPLRYEQQIGCKLVKINEKKMIVPSKSHHTLI